MSEPPPAARADTDQPASGRRWRARLRRRWGLSLVLVAALALAAWAGRARLLGPQVAVITPMRAPVIQTVVTTGRVAPPGQVRVAALSIGQVVAVYVDDGDAVTVGQALLALDDREARAQVAQAEADLARAQAQRREVRFTAGPAAKERLRQAQARFDEAERRFERDRALFERGTLSAAAFDDARTGLDVARSEARAIELEVASLSGQGSAWQQATAQLAQAEAQLEAARARRERLTLSAPTDGVVLRRQVEPGDAVSPGVELMTLARSGAPHLVVEPDETNLPLIQRGQPALASAEAYPERQFAATVRLIAPAVDRARGTIAVELDIAEPPEYLRADMTVSVEIEVGRRDQALVLPVAAVRDLASPEPWILALEDGVAVRRALDIGLRGDEHIEVLAGADETTAVIPASERDLTPGARARR